MALDEPYRSTILYRYLDDLSTQEIASKKGPARVGWITGEYNGQVQRTLAYIEGITE